VPPFGQHLLEVLIAHKPDSAQDDDLVFATTRGGHIHPSNVRTRGLQPAVEKANRELALTKVAPYCSILVSMDEDWATVAQQMRHADIATTQRYYTHAMRHRRNGIAERLDATLSEFRVAFRVASGSEGLVTGNTADAETRIGN
jgi:integrase